MSVAASKNDVFLDFVAARLNDPGIDRIFTKIGSENRRQGDSRPCLSKKMARLLRFDDIAKDLRAPRKQRRPVGEKPDVGSDCQDRRPRSETCGEFLIRKYTDDESCRKVRRTFCRDSSSVYFRKRNRSEEHTSELQSLAYLVC